MAESQILLETGTGEMEILEFKVGQGDYAINVIKIKEILEISNISPVPQSNEKIIGLTIVRGEVIPLIDMSYVLNNVHCERGTLKTLLCEFNNLKVAFCVDKVLGIRRVPWKEIKKPDSVIESKDNLIIGNITIGDRIVMLVDFEKVITDISPHTGITPENIDNLNIKEEKNRHKVKVLVADDSPMIRRLLSDALKKSGYTNLKLFENGLQVYEYLTDLSNKYKENVLDYVDVLVTDVEMPQMDGHTLTRKLKQNSNLKGMPVIIFSSLITDTLKHKGDTVQASAQISKPQVDTLVAELDHLFEDKLKED